MAFERLRAAAGGAVDPSRYHGGEAGGDVDETLSPQEWRDQTKRTRRQRLAARKHQAISLGFIGLIATMYIVVFTGKFFPTLKGNAVLLMTAKYGTVIPITVVLATRWQRNKLQRYDRLALQLPDGGRSYLGHYSEDSQGNGIFRPIKGHSWFGLKAEPLTLGDLGNDFTRTWAKRGRDASEPAAIRVEDGLTVTTKDATGRVVLSLTDGLEIDEYGRESDLYCAPPQTVDEERFKELRATLEDYVGRVDHLEDRLDAVKEQRDEYREEAGKRREEIKQDIVETHGELAEAGFTPSSPERRQRPDTTSHNFTPDLDND